MCEHNLNCALNWGNGENVKATTKTMYANAVGISVLQIVMPQIVASSFELQ